ncbi:MAG: NAD(P)-dependent oxidoreductase [Parachlamydiaceae bacterium]|nr:NAD(P)-dependent oxidoreductase [Parachlamydiaceae bacterium]
MKILFTGASSFSGMWFIEELANRGHKVVALFSTRLEDYKGIRLQRVKRIENCCTPIYNCRFGTSTCLDAIEASGPFDLFCHHAADVTNYKSPDFDYVEALKSNTLNIKKVLGKLKEQQCRKLLLTGSIFEQREGLCSEPSQAISPYGLSKGLTSDVFEYFSLLEGLHLGKFVIPNPFGPYEEGRYTSYLAKCWLQKTKAGVDFPLYIRDNIPVSLLAKSYATFAESLMEEVGFSKFSPSFKPEKQAYFVEHFSKEMQKRWGLSCEYEVKNQVNFPEPRVRINSDLINPLDYHWNESSAWDELADFYLATNSK